MNTIGRLYVRAKAPLTQAQGIIPLATILRDAFSGHDFSIAKSRSNTLSFESL